VIELQSAGIWPREITLIRKKFHNKSESLFFHMSPDMFHLFGLTESWQAKPTIGKIKMGLCDKE
jgi:hypothetical protein